MRMRFRRVFVIVALAIVLVVAAALFLVFSDFGSAKEPVINGMRLRRYVASGGPLMGDGKPLAHVGGEAIPWLIKGLEAEDSAFHRLKVRSWKLLPKEWRQKWRNRAPIDPRTLRANCMRTLEMFGPEAAAAVPKFIELAKSDRNVRAAAFNALAHMASASPEAKAFLVASLRDGDIAVKTDVAGAFVNAGWAPAEAVPLLVARLENYVPPNEHSRVPLNEMLALSVCGAEAAPAAPLLVQYITHGGPRNAITALRAMGPAAVVALPRLLEILADSDEWSTRLRPSVFAIIAGLGTNGAAALPTLTNGLSDPNPVVRVLAISGIANIAGDVEFAVPRLMEELENRSVRGRH